MSSKSLFLRNTNSALIVDYCGDLGIDLLTLSQKHGVDLNPGSGFHYASFNNVCNLYEDIARLGNDPHFGLNWALSQPEDLRHAGPIMYLLGIVSTYRGFIDILLKYKEVHTNGFHYSFQENHEDNLVSIQVDIHPLVRPCKQFIEHDFAATAKGVFDIMPDVRFKSVTFQHDGDPNDPVYEQVFRAPVTFNAQTNRLISDIKYLDRKIIDANLLIKRGMRSYFNYQIRQGKYHQSSISVTVAGLVPTLLGTGNVKQSAMAELMGLSPKKLQRLLADEGTSFSKILDQSRKAMAVRYLSQSNLTLKQIGGILDYASQETFIQAFHRWFKQTPSEFREKSKAE